MKLRDIFTGAKSSIARAITSSPLANALPLGFVEWMGKANSTLDRSLYSQYERIVFACITTIADDIGSADFRLYRDIQKTVPVQTHELLELIENPNPDLSKSDLLGQSQTYYEMNGEFFWYFAKGTLTRKPREIYLLPPDKMNVALDKKGNVIGYALTRGDGTELPLEIDEVYHYHDFNPHNKYRGYGTLQAGIEYVLTEKYATNYTKNFLYNNATPSSIISVGGKNGTITDVAFEKFKRQWQDKYGGTQKAGKSAFIRDAEVKVEKIGLGLNEIDMKALKEMTKEDIMMMFKVPKPLLGVSDSQGLGRASVESLEYIYMKRTIEPKLLKWDDILQKILTTWYGGGLYVGHESVIPADKEFELKERQASVDVWRTRNEIRKEDGLDNATGGDDLFVGFNQMTIGGGQATDKTNNKSKTIVTLAKRATQTPKKTDSLETSHKISGELDTATKESFRVSLLNIEDRYSKKLELETKKYAEQQLNEILSNMTPKKAMSLKAIDGTLPDEKAEIERYLLLIMPTILALMQTAGQHAVDFEGSDLTYQVTQTASDSAREAVRRGITSFNQQTFNKVTRSIAEGLKEGESLSKLTKRVQAVYGDITKYRAELIARTESRYNATKAIIDGYTQIPSVTGKQWYTNPGACEFCRSMDGKVIDLKTNFFGQGDTVTGVDGGEFEADYTDVDGPPLHPQCRCTLIPFKGEIQNSASNPTSQQLNEALAKVKELTDKLADADKRTKKAKKLQKEVDEWRKYATKLEGLIDGETET